MNLQDTPLLDISSFPPQRLNLRVAMVTETYPPEINGVSLTIEKLARGMQDRNHDIQVIRPRQAQDDWQTHMLAGAPILTRGLPIPKYPQLKIGLPAKRMMLEMWSKRRPDLVHIATEGPLGWSALKAAKKLQIPVSTDFRTNFHAYSSHYRVGWLQKPIMSYLKKFHNLAECTTVPTETLKKDLADDGFKRLVVIPRGIDMSRFNPAHRNPELRQQWGAEDNDRVLLYVGRVAPEKNLELLISTFEQVRAVAPRVQCVVVGDGPSLNALKNRLPWVHFAGAQQGEALAQHYASADIFVFPSLTETFGNVVPEAMASGLATVCFNYAAGQQLIQHGVNGLLCDTHDPATLTRSTIELTLNHPLRDRIRDATRSSPALQDWNDILLMVEQLWIQLVSFRPIP